jgi:tetratricopeptide (TPR) repeat protein/TolB-like protein
MAASFGIGQTFGHYQVLEGIGSGGMGEVYRARDLRLGREVALKILSADLLSDESARRRFSREAMALAKLNHPNVATLYEFAEHEGIEFLAMELVVGPPLNERIRSGPLPEPELLKLGAQLAEGLSAAHAEGVIHRDLKPANIAIASDGRLKILDFGIATLTHANNTTATNTQLTNPDMLPGTLPYMSPEQLQGEPADARSDVYSAGAVLYEIATGRRPFTQSGSAALMNAILNTDPVAPSQHNRRISPDLNGVILKALSKDPAQRYQSASELRTALESVRDPQKITKSHRLFLTAATAVAILLLAGGILGWKFGGWRTRLPGGISSETKSANGEAAKSSAVLHRRSVAVLGFKNLSARPEDQWMATAASEMLTTELALGQQIRTIPGESVVKTKIDLSLADVDSYGKETLGRIHRRLGSDYIVSGSYLFFGAEGNRQVRLDLHLQDAQTGEMLASVSETGTEEQIDELISLVGEELRTRLGVAKVPAAETASVRAALPANPRATRLYSEGLLKLRLFDALAARDLLQEAVAADPSFPLVHSALAAAWSALGFDAKAQDEAKKAFDLSASLSARDRMWVEGLYWETRKNWDRAVDLYSKLFALAPDDVEVGLRLAAAQTEAGKGKDAQATVADLKKIGGSALDDSRIDLAEERVANSFSDLKLEHEAADHAAQKAERQGARLLIAEARMNQGWALRNLGDPQKALEPLGEAKRVFLETDNQIGVARVLLNIGAAQSDVGDNDAAMETWKQSLNLARRLGNKKVEASALNNIAILLLQRGELSAAKTTHEKALALRQEIGDKNAITFSLLNLGNVLRTQGDLPASDQKMNEALELAREVGNRRIEATAMVNLANDVSMLGDPVAAHKKYQEAGKIFQAMGFKAGIAAAAKGRANALKDQGDLAGARKEFEQALAVQNEIGDRGGFADAQIDMASLNLEEGHAPAAEELLRSSMEELRKENRTDTLMDAQSVLSEVLVAQGKLSEAKQVAADLQLTLKKKQNLFVREELTLAIGRVNVALGKFDQAKQSLTGLLAESTRLGLVGTQFEARLTLGELEIKRGRLKEGRSLLESLQSDATSKGYLLMARKAQAAMRLS